ncbi:MAG: Gfo/Idh/MocA family oxidoreductase [Patescibacteria group bacterium]
MKRFALIGAAGYIAEKHMKAIAETGNDLVAAVDISDSVGILDKYFPQAHFFTDFEKFEKHIDLLREQGEKIDYVSICTPNYLHDSHIRFALKCGADAICEKPLALDPRGVEALADFERKGENKIYTILQLRLHPKMIELKKRIEDGPKDKIYDVILTYNPLRGRWYFSSWKGQDEKAGGIVMNIGVHFFDTLIWLFGNVKESIVHVMEPDRSAGYLDLERARVKWLLSLREDTLPAHIKIKPLGDRYYRSITVDGEEVEFSTGFADLHTLSYKEILRGDGFGPREVMPSIEVVHNIRIAKPIGLKGEYHPFLKK